jgi:hypothetical protein
MRKINLRLWTKILLLVCALACGTVILLAARSNSARPAPTAQQTESGDASATATATFNGIVTDTRCGAKHSARIGLDAADCTRACVHAGERFALVDGDKAYILTGDSVALKHLAGARVRVAGTLNGDTITVVSVAELDPKAE